jgi:hypothetical protein
MPPDDVFGLATRDAGRLNIRTNLDALAASRAGVEHCFDTFAQSCLEFGISFIDCMTSRAR